ncbi:MAG TPA: VOC family protein [Anaerolineales bacterium]|jgi:catechol 2,3-dioxygenase-like lactoylglutathione lyase family enzyme
MTVLANNHLSVVVPATDLARAKDFYQGKLGLKLVSEEEQGLAFEAGAGTGIFVYLRPGGGPAEHTVAGWRVKDVEAAVAELGVRGVTFEVYDMPGLKTDERGIARMGDRLGAWFKDSEGNILSINSM